MATKSAVRSRKSKSLGFYTSTEAARISSVPHWTVDSWRRQGIIVPSAEWTDEQDKTHLGYTFETVVFLRLIRMLRAKRVTLFDAVTGMRRLRYRFGTPSTDWAGIKLFVQGAGNVYVHGQDEWETTSLTKPHQKVAELLFGEQFQRLRERADALLVPNQFLDYVEIDPAIQNGLPIVSGTTVLTSLVHRLKGKGYEYSDIHQMYPFMPNTKIMGAEEYELFLDKASFN